MTFELLIFSAALSLSLGIIFGVLISPGFSIKGVASIIKGVTFILRAIPLFVQVLIIYFVFDLDAFIASILSLGLCSSGYVANIVKSMFLTLPNSQWECAHILGYSKRQMLWYLFFPQFFRAALPSLTNELESLLKSTAVLSSIGVLELTRVGMNIVSREMQPLQVYAFVALFYICLSCIINFISKVLQEKLSYARS